MRLPKMNDQTKIIVCTAVALVGVDLAVRAMMTPRTIIRTGDVVTAREFRLVDDTGNVRIRMVTDGDRQPGIVLYDKDGQRRAQLDTFETVPSLILFNDRGGRSTYYGMDSAGRSILQMYDENGSDGYQGNPVATMSASRENNVPGFTWNSEGQTIRFEGGRLNMFER